MNRSQRYVYEVFSEKSFSRAAEKLYISQPSLSATVKKLERELGFDIFDRSQNPVSLTREGKIYIEYLEEIIKSEREMKSRILKESEPFSDRIAVGGSNYISRLLLPVACGEYHSRFPGVEVVIDLAEYGTSNLIFEKVERGELDVALSHRVDPKIFSAESIFKERYVIVMHRDMPGADKIAKYAVGRDELLSGNYDREKLVSDYGIFEGISFIRYGRGGSVWQDMHELLEYCSFSNCKVVNSKSSGVHYDMMLTGNGAVVTGTLTVLHKPEKSDELLYFPTSKVRDTLVLYRRYKGLGPAAREFVEIMRGICREEEKRCGMI